ncbi:TIGR03618 family F420-dependent PPOX class oxidoreductase [Nocardia sp. NBC_00565]|uniref:TIGR03618 family F420-dependent PPOX class oxidoreductase n=1 Tax=Nocardia sp. NBC_00565 TaxID=2975993 RepID=UPI002E8099A5|nr:TIGR03618 family F420-dependent PPOX class oxidoreductase [Nocardia sp. NBC_00565]WUC06174.1 TIGR03618 family F420-dependent PPOX class oxidoreductase [Nocardia sp. NBC_00565]
MTDIQESSYEPGRGAAPTRLSTERVEQFLGVHRMGALATIKRDGHPHLSTVAYKWNPVTRVVSIGSTADRVKVRQLARNPHTALYVSSLDQLTFAVAEGAAEISPVSTVPGDPVGREMLAMFPEFDNPDDEATFLKNMVEDNRLVIRLQVSKLYGDTLVAEH